ncbi:MBL fold metallo-hydrolase [Streptomyces sp. NBC_01381]|uniref:MBL fold metallo-hydrolase n=1 Tax=Streptomyces sp. NBC_01381 TaxID=2903845 RepID=UPI00224F73DE|nr:MBL fold metallo-hydrolase [Streptomyces sp. NBC_01381]MCX4666569.1 MBL fold metallo-hydrolase [Streptomyces sp. NBC_01381]
MISPALRPLSASSWAWMHDRTDWGFSNSGVIASGGEVLLVDTQFTLPATRLVLDAVGAAVPGGVIGTVVATHGNGDHTWGNQLLPDAEIVTSIASTVGLCHEMGPEQLTALAQSHSADPATRYISRNFGHFDFAGITVVRPTRTFSGREEVKVGSVLVELLDLGAGHSAGDVAVHVPDEGVVFAGDALFADSHMVVWSGSLSGCIQACGQVLDTGAEVFVPGHGPLLDRSGVTGIRDQLFRVQEAALDCVKAGVPLADAARRVMAGHAGSWAHPERLFTQVAAVYEEAGATSVPASTLAMVEGMASLAC